MEKVSYFPILKLPKYLLQYLMQEKFMTPASIRNFMICCKAVYEAAPEHLRKEYLWHLAKLERYRKWNIWPAKMESERCVKCGHHVPRKQDKHLKKCPGAKRCHICWLLVPTNSVKNHFRGCPSKVCIELSLTKSQTQLRNGAADWDVCNNCKSKRPARVRCNRCWSVRYCTRQCRKEDAENHQELCRDLQRSLRDRK